MRRETTLTLRLALHEIPKGNAAGCLSDGGNAVGVGAGGVDADSDERQNGRDDSGEL
jgi:hypothetical protein